MKNKLVLILCALVVGVLPTTVSAQSRLRVVTTLATFADLVEQVGGEYVKVDALVSPKFNPHFIEPKPGDVLKVKRADLFVHAGLDLELWRFSLVDAAGNTQVRPGGDRELDLSQGVMLLDVPNESVSRAQGDIHIYGNPHYWLSPKNVKVMVQSLAEKLSNLDAEHADEYQQSAERYIAELDRKIQQWEKAMLSEGQGFVAYHNEWLYLAHFLGLESTLFLEPNPGIPPTPKHVGKIKALMKEHNIRTIVRANYNPSSVAEALARELGVSEVVLCPQVNALKPCTDYLQMMNYNVQSLKEALLHE